MRWYNELKNKEAKQLGAEKLSAKELDNLNNGFFGKQSVRSPKRCILITLND